jgi:hypothetical protein
MRDYSNHMLECYWHLRSPSDDPAQENMKVELMDGAQACSVAGGTMVPVPKVIPWGPRALWGSRSIVCVPNVYSN